MLAGQSTVAGLTWWDWQIGGALQGASFCEDGAAHSAATDPYHSAVAWPALPVAARVYVGAVTVLGVLAIASAVPSITEHNTPLFATLAILSLIVSFAKVNLPVPRSASTLTVCYVIDFTTLLLLGRPAATLTAVIGVWSQCTFRCRHQGPAYMMWFSVGTLALTVQAAGLTYEWLGGQPGLPRSLAHGGALFAAATVHFLINTAFVAGAVGLSTGQAPSRVWLANYAWIWPGHLLGFSVAVVAAAGIGRSSLVLIPFALALLALTYRNFKAYATRFADSVIDPLTELPNRRYLVSHVAQELARARRDDAPLALMLIDLNGFKSINDTSGHSAGDVALRHIAHRLQQSVRTYDICARYGGDEFVAVLPGCTAVDAQRKADALRTAVADLKCDLKPGVTASLGISVGIAVFPVDGETFEQLMGVADARMFQEKGDRGGRAEPAGGVPAAGERAWSLVQKMTERELREQLFQAQKMAAIGQLAGTVAHDFNNALTAIIGYSDLLTEQIGPDKPIGRDLMEIVSAAQHAAALTHQLLAFSRKQDLPSTAVDLNEVVCSAEAMLRRLLGERIAVVTKLTAGLYPVMANATQLGQVLINLSVNARDAMPDGGVLEIGTQTTELDAGDAAAAHPAARAGAYAVLSVSDTGTGMTPEVRSRILEPFFTTKAPGRGTGLGLAVVSGIVAQLGGWIAVDTEQGHGTTFRIYFPTTPGAAEPSEAPAPGVTVVVPSGSETILLVEDDEGVREFATIALRRHGYRVLEAESAEAALALLQREMKPIHLLVTDIVLPGLDGRELAARVESQRPRTAVLFTTGYGHRTRERGEGSPPEEPPLLRKPFTARALLTRTRDVLDQRGS